MSGPVAGFARIQLIRDFALVGLNSCESSYDVYGLVDEEIEIVEDAAD